MSALPWSVGDPTEDGRYVVFTPCAAESAREYLEPRIATWHAGRWHFAHPVWSWIGPLPVIHGDEVYRALGHAGQ